MKCGEDRYHVACFHCASCDAILTKVVFIEEVIMCPPCAADYRADQKRLADAALASQLHNCAACGDRIEGAELFALDKYWHGMGCFTCGYCARDLSTKFAVADGVAYCNQGCFEHAQAGDAPPEPPASTDAAAASQTPAGDQPAASVSEGESDDCYACAKPVTDSKSMRVPPLGRFHIDCYVCGACTQTIGTNIVARPPASEGEKYRLFCCDACAEADAVVEA